MIALSTIKTISSNVEAFFVVENVTCLFSFEKYVGTPSCGWKCYLRKNGSKHTLKHSMLVGNITF
jgi:hypothetical protein